jgi:superfamily I DNA/RNA helicase
MDIMGVIKGTASVETKFEPLSRGSYCEKRWSLAPNFKSQERDTVYSLYERYESIKKKRGEIDDADRVMRVLKALENYTELREQVVWLLQEVYVDGIDSPRGLSFIRVF